jgi:hypothetical protein
MNLPWVARAPHAGLRAAAVREPAAMGEASLALSAASAALVAAAFLLRPGALGQDYAPVAMVLAVAIVGTYFLIAPGRLLSGAGRNGRDVLFVGGLFVAYWAYETALALLRRTSNETQLMKEFLVGAVTVCSYGLFLADDRGNRTFFRMLTTVVALFGWSSVVTFLLSLVLGPQRLYLTSIAIKGYQGGGIGEASTGALYFPFSMQYASYEHGALKVTRYCNFFREAGIYQCVALFLLAYEQFTRRSKLVSLGLVAGVVLSFSTIGFVLLPAIAGLIFVTRNRVRIGRTLALGVVSAAAVVVMANVPAFGVADKLSTHGSSVTDRSTAIQNGMSSMISNPLGSGIFSPAVKNEGICLLASVATIGVVGALIQLIILSGWRPITSAVSRRMIVCFPLLVTALLSQPIAGDAMTYLLAMVMVPIPEQ